MARNETKYMESVIAIAEELNFTLAAQKVGVSQPVISRNLAELEAKPPIPIMLIEAKHE